MIVTSPSPLAEPVVHIDRFTMSFAKRTVIDGLSFDVMRGETFGFLGSNGSGKTTTIRALLGIYQATAGTLHIGGRPFSPDNGVRLGYLPEERGLYKKESVLDVMVYFGRLKGLAHDTARHWSLDYLERVDMAQYAATRVDRLSSGQQQKVQLGVTILNSPELLILDEPTKGFDPVNRRLLMDILADEKKRGTTVMMVTHQMDEVERLCDRIILLKDGGAEAYGTVTEVQDRYGGTTIRVRYAGVIPASACFTVNLHERNYAELAPVGDAEPAEVLKALVDAGVAVSEFTTNRRSLEEIFLMIYGDESPTAAH
jgi:ABC-2 type transport system ATP-binding protein